MRDPRQRLLKGLAWLLRVKPQDPIQELLELSLLFAKLHNYFQHAKGCVIDIYASPNVREKVTFQQGQVRNLPALKGKEAKQSGELRDALCVLSQEVAIRSGKPGTVHIRIELRSSGRATISYDWPPPPSAPTDRPAA